MLHGPEVKTLGSSQALKTRFLGGVNWGRAICEFKAEFGGVGKRTQWQSKGPDHSSDSQKFQTPQVIICRRFKCQRTPLARIYRANASPIPIMRQQLYRHLPRRSDVSIGIQHRHLGQISRATFAFQIGQYFRDLLFA